MEILCSENARISPDPGEVEDWGKLQNFTVTATIILSVFTSI